VKLTAFLFLAACLHVSAKGYSQTVTLSRTNVSLVSVFQEIQRQTGYNFLFTYEELEGVGPVTVDLRNVPLNDAIGSCLQGKPLTWSIVEKTVVIKPRAALPKSDLPDTEAPDPGGPIHGRVADSVGNPLDGASVTIKGTKIGTKTNVKGEFEIKNFPNGSVLVISYLGYSVKQVVPPANGFVYAILQRSQDILDAPIVQAYGTTSRRLNVGSITTVDAETIARQPVTNVLLALQGQVPGLNITATSGVPGSSVQVQVRGQNTLQNGLGFKPYDQPLFIIDGTPFAPQNGISNQLGNLSTPTGQVNFQAGLSPFNGINPLDIESISVLRDADATSIYGTQGSNGVILITTKKGKPGKTAFSLNVNTGFNYDARSIKFMNTPQYLQMRKDAFAADGITPSANPGDPGYAPDLTIFDQNKYTDWQKVIYGKTSNNTNVYASLSGGSQNTTFLASAGYTRSDYNFPGNFADQRLSLHNSVHHTSTDNRLTIDLGTDFSFDQNNSAQSGNSKVLNPPNLPDLRDAAGNLVWNYKGADLTNYQFYANLKEPTLAQTYNLNSTLRLGYKILPGLSVTGNFGYSRNTTNEHNETPLAAQNPMYATATADFANSAYQTIIAEPQIDYKTNIGKGALSVLAGASYKKNLSSSFSILGTGYANDNFLGSIDGATTTYPYDASNIYKYSAGFGRIQYVYDRKYIISFNGRRDGSSNFGPGNRFGNFGSAAAGWIFSEEKAFKKALPFISFGKLYGSYGTTGSDGSTSYQYQAFWKPISGVPAFQGVQPSLPVNLYNPDYSWALKKSLTASLDLGFFHDRLALTASFYRDREGNQLAGYPLPAQVGLSSVLENLHATVQNKGWEFMLNSTNIKTKYFTWSTNFNLSLNRNKLLSFPNLAASSYANTYVIGQPTNVVFGFKFKGLNPTTGLYEFYDRNGKATSNPNFEYASQGGDLAPITNTQVKYMGGFGNTFSYKRFSLNVFFQFSSQTATNWLAAVNYLYPGVQQQNLPVQALNYWKGPGDNTPLQRLGSGYGSPAIASAGAFGQSTGGYSDDTYFRLKTLSLSYNLSDAALKRLHIKDCRVFINAQNLLTFTDYKVGDPELFGNLTAFPLQRIVAGGLSFNF
jgi:TonB-linked SusC/RagA family outer membrane protein